MKQSYLVNFKKIIILLILIFISILLFIFSRKTSSASQVKITPKDNEETLLEEKFKTYVTDSGVGAGSLSYFLNNRYKTIIAGNTDIDSTFRIASCSKIITAAGIFQAINQGYLKLDDRLSLFLNPANFRLILTPKLLILLLVTCCLILLVGIETRWTFIPYRGMSWKSLPVI